MQPMDFVPEEQHDSSQALRACICLASSIRHEGLGETFESAGPKRPKEHSPGFTPGLPWVSPPTGISPEGAARYCENRLRTFAPDRGRVLAPSGRNVYFTPTQGKPWAKLSCPFRAGPFGPHERR
jgi:hypothetical protein